MSAMESNIVSLSGGKDSTAMLLMMLERGEPVTDIVFFDTGWDFPRMHEHLDRLEAFIGRKITRLHPRLSPRFHTARRPLDFMFADYPVASRATGEIHRIGRGWPRPGLRWCTGRKQEAFKSYYNGLTYLGDVRLPLASCVGFAADESHRVEGVTKAPSEYIRNRYPLIEWGWTESDALQYCYDAGFDWGGLYEHFDRVSCFCCPLQSLDDLRKIHRHFPELWARMLEMESWLPEASKLRRFKGGATVSDLDARFAADAEFEARKIPLPGVFVPKEYRA